MLVVDSGFLKKNPDAVRRMVAAHVKATEYIRANRLEAADMAHLFTGQDRPVVNRAMKNIDFTYMPDIKGIRRYVEFLAGNGVIKSEDPGSFTRELVDVEFLPGEGP